MWSKDDTVEAITKVVEGRMGYKRASQTFKIPQSTLENRVKRARRNDLPPECAAEKRLGRFMTVFTEAQETELISVVLNLEEEKLCNVTLRDLRKLAYEFAEKK